MIVTTFDGFGSLFEEDLQIIPCTKFHASKAYCLVNLLLTSEEGTIEYHDMELVYGYIHTIWI